MMPVLFCENGENMLSTNLFKGENESSTFVDATITEEGDLRILKNAFGPGDYETEVTAAISATEKDQLLLALLVHVYAGDKNALENFIAFARSRSLHVATFRWP
jgi:hypothetical protein